MYLRVQMCNGVSSPSHEDGCSGRYLDPSCRTPEDCVYRAEWFASGNFVRFRVAAKVDPDSWVAIGFSADTQMVCMYVQTLVFVYVLTYTHNIACICVYVFISCMCIWNMWTIVYVYV